MFSIVIHAAIEHRQTLRITDEWGARVVEPHAFGRNKKGHDVLRAYQTGGASESNEPVGWKIFRVDEIVSLELTGYTFPGPRPGYKRNDTGMTTIYCQL